MCNLWHYLQLIEGGQYLVEVEAINSKSPSLKLEAQVSLYRSPDINKSS